MKNKIRLNEAQLHKVIKESVKKILRESMKACDGNNIVPEDTARKLGFQPEYKDGDGLELWGRSIKNGENPRILLKMLGINRFTSQSINGKVRITVQPNPPKESTCEWYT